MLVGLFSDLSFVHFSRRFRSLKKNMPPGSVTIVDIDKVS